MSNGKSKVVLTAAAVLLAVASTAQPGSAPRLEMERIVPPDPPIELAIQAWQSRGRLVVLDQKTHRLLFFTPDLQLDRTLGRIGQKPGEFFYPAAFALDSQDNIYVKDGSNRRIQIFDWAGNYLSEFPDTPKSIGLAVNSKGEILLGQPHLGKLITVYDREGKRLRSFGELKKLSDFYGADLAERDGEFKYAVNRVRISLDRDDNVYAAFLAAPFFQKYDASGELIFEKIVGGPEGEEIIGTYAETQHAPGRIAIDNVAVPIIVSGVAVHWPSGNVFISFQWSRSRIFVARPTGEALAILEPPEPIILTEIGFAGDMKSILTTRVFMRSDAVYRLTPPAWLLEPVSKGAAGRETRLAEGKRPQNH